MCERTTPETCSQSRVKFALVEHPTISEPTFAVGVSESHVDGPLSNAVAQKLDTAVARDITRQRGACVGKPVATCFCNVDTKYD
jgi:hypothetical protein